MLADTETEVTGLGEVLLSQLVLLDLEATLENLLSLGATDGNVDGDLFVTTDTEGTDGVTGLAYSHTKIISAGGPFSIKIFDRGILTVDRSLTTQLLKNLGGTSESVTRLADTDVQHQLLDAQLAHGVGALVLNVRLHRKSESDRHVVQIEDCRVAYHGDSLGVELVDWMDGGDTKHSED